MTKHVTRRVFLRGLGGACVAAPFLSSVAERSVQAQALTPPKRLIVMFTNYGCITTRFFPSRSHGPLSAADLEATTLKHLAPFADKLLLPRGIRAMNEWTSTLARGQGNDMHSQMASSFFTCQPVLPNSDEPFLNNIPSRFPPKPIGPSLDHVMAKQLSPNGTPLFIRLANAPMGQGISWSAAETIHNGLSLKQAFGSLTGLMQDGPLSPDTYQAMRGKSIIDLVRNDLNTLQRSDMSRSDRNKLEAWKQLLDETGRGVGLAACSPSEASKLGVTQANVDTASRYTAEDADLLTTKITDSLDGADIHSNLAALAAACQLNPVIFLKFPSNFIFRGLGIDIDSHNLSHRTNNAGLLDYCFPGALEMLLKVDDYYARKFAHLVGVLNSIDEGDQKLLDHTAAVWFQGQSDGLAHNLNNLPIVQAGSAGGYFKTGWSVNVDDGAADLTAGNSEFFCADGTATDQANGVNQATGTDPTLANAPINKYFCNLMNALGVKAGPDGFPLPGGTAEVSRFGMSDLTEDFIHAGNNPNPPTIHDPGEFTALKA
ncbi:MAG TPA: DUF1552 domain-containing protein [Polyangiaceae bacterium]|nr:DUF1552 domain-containing protein [Polyangiaceae bacterium]